MIIHPLPPASPCTACDNPANSYNPLVDFGVTIGLDRWDFIAVTIAVISAIIAVISAIYAIRTYRAQVRTERNTMRITEEGQLGLLVDYIRHFYSNLVAIKAIRFKLIDCPYGIATSHDELTDRIKHRLRTHYPSEEHLRKLSIDTESLHPEAFVHTRDKYDIIHNLLLLARNYNIETQVAEMHICSSAIAPSEKMRDFSTLIFKQNHLCKKFLETLGKLGEPSMSAMDRYCLRHPCILELSGQTVKSIEEKYAAARVDARAEIISRVRKKILKQAVNRQELPDTYNHLSTEGKISVIRQQLKSLESEIHRPVSYFTEEEMKDNNFCNLIFLTDDKERKRDEKQMFFDLLNANIYHEIHAKSSGYDKIAILSFPTLKET